LTAFGFERGTFAAMNPGQKLSRVVAAAAFSRVAWGLHWGRLAALARRRVRDALFLTVILGLLAFGFPAPRCEMGLGQLGVLSLWGFVPFGVLVGYGWGMATAERKKGAT
jgi:hypothetical protein